MRPPRAPLVCATPFNTHILHSAMTVLHANILYTYRKCSTGCFLLCHNKALFKVENTIYTFYGEVPSSMPGRHRDRTAQSQCWRSIPGSVRSCCFPGVEHLVCRRSWLGDRERRHTLCSPGTWAEKETKTDSRVKIILSYAKDVGGNRLNAKTENRVIHMPHWQLGVTT